MSDDSTVPVDLSSLGIDLSQIFRPSWTVEQADAPARLAAQFDEGAPPDAREARHQRHGGERSFGRNARGSSHGERNREDRNQRSNSRLGQKKSGGDPHRENARRREDQREPQSPRKPALEGWKLTLIPKVAAIEGIAKQVRARAKAYPLFELARLIVKLSDRYSVKLQAESNSAPELFRAKADGSIWTSRKEAVSHLLSHHIEKFYLRSSITTEAPKGAYSVVAECSMSGTLLGPPNHHEYQSRLLALHAARFKNLPFEVYKSRIRMVRDEALMERWKTEQSTKTIFFPIEQEAGISSGEEIEISQNKIESQDDLPPLETPEAEVPAVESSPENTSASGEEIPGSPEELTSSVAATEETPDVQKPEAETLPESTKSGLSFEEVVIHFNENHAATEVEPAESEITLAGHVALHGSTPALRELLLRSLQELDRFPLPLAQLLGKELSSHGLHLFKAHKKIIHVSVARPRHLDRETTPTTAGFCSILDYLEAHPKQHRDKQWAGLLALHSEPADPIDESISEEVLKRREQALGADLLWLLHQGHVIDFAMGNLQVAMRPVPKPQVSKEPSSEPNSIEKQPPIEEKPADQLSLPEEAPKQSPSTREYTKSIALPATE